MSDRLNPLEDLGDLFVNRDEEPPKTPKPQNPKTPGEDQIVLGEVGLNGFHFNTILILFLNL